MDNYIIRKVVDGDAYELARIQVESWRAAFSDIISAEQIAKYLDYSYVEKMYQKLLDNHKGHGYIMQVNGDYHCIAYWDKARNVDDDKTAELICIHSMPKRWRKGYGSKMMDTVLADMKTRGFQRVILWVFEKNERACSFYEASGFQRTGDEKESFGTKEISYWKEV